MTKDKIKKALECCAKSYGDDVHCSDCPYDTLTPRACCERFCQDVLCKDALDLIIEQENEIERLRTTLGQCNTELNSALESLKSQCREIGELKAEKKQAQIDVLNKVKEKLDSAPNGWAYTTYIDELIEEVEEQ